MSELKTAEKKLLSLESLVFEAVTYEITNRVLTITLNRPESRNAINIPMGNEVSYLLDYAKQEKDIRVVTIAANGNIFCAGGDLKAMLGGDTQTTSTVPSIGEASDMVEKIRNLHKPVVIKAAGDVLAGGLLMLCNATHVIAADHISISAPEIKRGLWPYMVMAAFFRLVPKRLGLDFIMQGFAINAKTALDWNLINRAVPLEQLDEEVARLETQLASLAPNTMQLGLEAYCAQEDMDMTDALPYLNRMLQKTIAGPDAREGITAFLNKQKPNWE